MFDSRKAGRMAAVALATTVAVVGTVRAQTLGACRLVGCRTGTEVAQLLPPTHA